MFDHVAPPLDAQGCSPKDQSSFQPPPFVPPVPQQNACSATQIQAFFTYCAGPQATSTGCQFWVSKNKVCDACLESPDNAKAWGALVSKTDGYVPNTFGCVATLGYPKCAERAVALDACTDAACHDNCPRLDDGGNGAYDACRTAAETSVCKSYRDQVSTVCPAPLGVGEGSSIALCLQSDLQTFYMAFAQILCGAGG